MNKIIISLFFLLLSNDYITAQNNDCLERQLAKAGKWTKLKETIKSAPADLAIQRRFYNAAHNPLQASYQPKGLDAAYSGSFQPVQYKQPVAHYWYTIFGERYFCEGDGLWLNKFDINSTLQIFFNDVSFLEIYDTASVDHSPGYWALREGFPVEIRPGIWQFNDVRTSLGAGTEGVTKHWLITYDGQLPWSFVTRREFLVKRKRFLQRQAAVEALRLKEQLAGWETMKKAKEQEYKSDPARLASYISGTHNPALEREQANHKRTMQSFENALARLDEQLAAPADELNKKAIVIKSTKNHLDYDFTDKMEPFAELLTKPNPAYFKKWSSPAVPQMITVSIIYDPQSPVSVGFAKEMEKIVNLDYIKSFIGQTTPPTFNGNRAAQISPGGSTSTAVTTQNSAVKTVANTNTTKPAKATTAVQNSSNKALFLSGVLSAPAGVAVTLGYNGGNELALTQPKAANLLYHTSAIKFTKAIDENKSIDVTLKKVGSNMNGMVYNGNAKAADGINKVKIAVDYKYELLTRSTSDKSFSSFYESFAPAVGGYNGEEGRYVVFVSNTKDFEGSNGKFRQVFWKDRNTGITKMISVSPTGDQGNGDCAEPSISADGKTVVFESKATNLVQGDNTNFKDIFLWRATTNSIELVSKATNGGAADAESFDAAVSGNGNFVVFTSSATNLSQISKGRSVANIFLRDVLSGKTEMISVDIFQKTGGNGYKGSISFDGSRISFCSSTPTLVEDDKNGLWDIFLWQKGQASLKRISLTHDGKERNGGTESASRQVASAISGNGRYLAFATTASNMVSNDVNNFQDVFVVDVETGKVNVASFANDGQPSNGGSPIEQGERVAINYDGSWVAFPTKATNLGAAGSNIILHNTPTGKKIVASNVSGSYVGRPSISYNGGYVVFAKSTNLDTRFSQSGIFAHFTGNGPCRDCKDE